MRELDDGETFAILKYPGWWIKDDVVVGFGQISPKGGVDHVLWGTATGAAWEPMPRGVIVVIIATDSRAPFFLMHHFARTIKVQ